jgi:hypothetical protein
MLRGRLENYRAPERSELVVSFEQQQPHTLPPWAGTRRRDQRAASGGGLNGAGMAHACPSGGLGPGKRSALLLEARKKWKRRRLRPTPAPMDAAAVASRSPLPTPSSQTL